MQSEGFIRLIEEMIEVKIRQHLALRARGAKSTEPLSRLLAETYATDHRRLEQIKGELAGILEANEEAEQPKAEQQRLRMCGNT